MNVYKRAMVERERVEREVEEFERDLKENWFPSPEEMDRRIVRDSAKYGLGFKARVMKNFNPYSPRIIWRGLGERIKHWYGMKLDFRFRWLRWRYGKAFLGTTRKNGKTEAILR